MAEWEIDRTNSKEIVAQNPVKLLHLVHQVLLILALVTCAIIRIAFGYEGMEMVFFSTLETRILILVMVLDLLLVWMYSTRSIFADLETYLRTVAIVFQDYALLITLNRKYIEIAIIPLTIFAFIYALASKGNKYQREEVGLKEMAMVPDYLLQLPLVVWKQYKEQVALWKGLTKSAKQLMKMAMVPYLLQLSLVVCTQYKGQVEEGNRFTFSSFLMFLGSALCAITVMIASGPIGVSPSVIQVLPVMHKTCIVMLMMTAHSMAAEWLGEDMVFACMPELTSVLAWFTIYCHHPEHVVRINKATSHRSLAIIFSLVVSVLACLASFYAHDMSSLRAWFLRVFCISSSSSALSYLDVWLLDHWPAGSTQTSSGGLVQLLKFSSVISSCVSACMLCTDPHNWHEAIKYITTAAAHFPQVFQLMHYVLRECFMYILIILLIGLAIRSRQIKIRKRACPGRLCPMMRPAIQPRWFNYGPGNVRILMLKLVRILRRGKVSSMPSGA